MPDDQRIPIANWPNPGSEPPWPPDQEHQRIRGLIPLGELHADSVCAYCGRGGRLEVDLKRTVHRVTLAVAHVCVDSSACERRRYRAKNP